MPETKRRLIRSGEQGHGVCGSGHFPSRGVCLSHHLPAQVAAVLLSTSSLSPGLVGDLGGAVAAGDQESPSFLLAQPLPNRGEDLRPVLGLRGVRVGSACGSQCGSAFCSAWGPRVSPRGVCMASVCGSAWGTRVDCVASTCGWPHSDSRQSLGPSDTAASGRNSG